MADVLNNVVLNNVVLNNVLLNNFVLNNVVLINVVLNNVVLNNVVLTAGSIWSLAMPSFISKVLHARSAGHPGNVEGDGFTLGGLMLVSKHGVAYEHLETDFGVRADPVRLVQLQLHLSPHSHSSHCTHTAALTPQPMHTLSCSHSTATPHTQLLSLHSHCTYFSVLTIYAMAK